jgi:hypothetical protein
MKEAVDIIRHRAKEVAAILAFNLAVVICMLLTAGTRYALQESTLWSKLFMAIYPLSMGLMIILALAYFGFYRSVATNPFEPKTIRWLLSTGKTFFWRLFVIQLLLTVAVMGISYIPLLLLSPAVNEGQGGLRLFMVSVWWLRGSSSMIAYIFLAIPYVLAACLILVRDCSVGQAVKGIFSVRLAGTNLIPLAIAAAVLNSLWSFVPFDFAQTAAGRIIHVPWNVAVSFFNILAAVFAIRMLTRQFGVWQRQPEAA